MVFIVLGAADKSKVSDVGHYPCQEQSLHTFLDEQFKEALFASYDHRHVDKDLVQNREYALGPSSEAIRSSKLSNDTLVITYGYGNKLRQRE